MPDNLPGGPILHYFGFYVDGMDAEIKKLVSQGIKFFICEPGSFAYLDAESPATQILASRSMGSIRVEKLNRSTVTDYTTSVLLDGWLL